MIEDLKRRIDAARGGKGDLLIKNVKLVNVLSQEIYKTNVVVEGGFIAGVGGRYKNASKVFNFADHYLLPGLIDSHIHIESSLLNPVNFAISVIPHGTTTVISDPHEIANVLGVKGIKYMIKSSRATPIDIFFTIPSCVPATSMETSGAEIENVGPLLTMDNIIGLGEMMNFPGVIYKDETVLKKIVSASERHRIIDGHAPTLTGDDLNAYICAGVRSDHECVTKNEAIEKLRKGMYIMIREGSAAKNLEELIRVVNKKNYRRFMFCSDDRHPKDLLQQGHIDFILRKSVSKNLDPVLAVTIATLNPSEYFGLRDRGAIAPGYIGDLTIVKNLRDFKVKAVFKNGKPIFLNNKLLVKIDDYRDVGVMGTVRAEVNLEDLKLRGDGNIANVIGVVENQIITKRMRKRVKRVGGLIVSDVARDILKIAVVDRHRGTGNVGLGLVNGFGLKKGAIGSTVAHDSHNIIVVGTNDKDMLVCIKRLVDMGGGYVICAGGRVISELPLPIAGLMSDKDAKFVAQRVEKLHKTAKKLGTMLKNPFMTLSFLALPVIPELKLTDKGLVDVEKFEIIPLFAT